MKNDYKIEGDTTIIYCRYKDETVECYIDTSDLPLLMSKNWTWRAVDNGSKTLYVFGNNLALHRFLMTAEKGSIIDHIDRNGLNNRRKSNLRVVTPTESVRNRMLFKNSTSGHPGVNWSAQYRKWKARIRVDGKDVYLGRFDTLEEAIRARKEGEEKYWS